MHAREEYLQKRARSFPVPVISAGNISMGGTGKTPVCAYLLQKLAASGHRPVVLTRGYKSDAPRYPHMVHPREDPEVCGDEPLLLSRVSRKGRVVVDHRRTRSASWALKHLSPTVFILDDAFQHLHIHRDLNLVILTPKDLGQEWNRVFPAGMWREGLHALHRADVFLVNIQDRDPDAVIKTAEKRLLHFRRRMVFFDVQPWQLINLDSGGRTLHIQNRSYFLLSAVAAPEKIFSSACKFFGYPPLKHMVFADHHPLGTRTAEAVARQAGKLGIKDVVCTAKDAVKLKPWPGLSIWVLEARVVFSGRNEQKLWQSINKCMK